MGKKKKSEPEAEKDTFMMMFVTLSLILLAFFILLNSMAVMDNQKKRMALGSLLGSFGIMPGGDSADNSKKQAMKKASLISSDGMYKMFKEVKKEIEVILSNEEEKEKGGLSATFDEKTGEIKIVLAERLLFPPGEAVVSIRLFSLLDKTADIAMKTGGKVIVTGHTDNRSGSRTASNWRLSMDRGIIVARHLEAIGPLEKGQIIGAGASHYQPIRENDTEEGRAANRRVEIQIRTKEAGF